MMWAAFRISRANGWKFVLPGLADPPNAELDTNLDSNRSSVAIKEISYPKAPPQSERRTSVKAEIALSIKLTALVAVLSYATKYGETFFSVPFNPGTFVRFGTQIYMFFLQT